MEKEFDHTWAEEFQNKVVKALYSESDAHMNDISDEFKNTEEYY